MITNYEALCLQKPEVFMQLLGFKITFMTSIRQIIFSAQLAEKNALLMQLPKQYDHARA